MTDSVEKLLEELNAGHLKDINLGEIAQSKVSADYTQLKTIASPMHLDISNIQPMEDGRLAFMELYGKIYLWDVSAEKSITTLTPPLGQAANSFVILDNNRLLSYSSPARRIPAQLWDIKSGKPMQQIIGLVSPLAMLSENTLITINEQSNGFSCWNLTTTHCEMTVTGTRNISALAVLSQTRIAMGYHENIFLPTHLIKIYDLKNKEEIIFKDHHTNIITTILPLTNNRLITGSYDFTLKIWDIETGCCLNTFTGHMGKITALAALDNELVISGSADNTLKIWDLKTGQCIKILTGHAGPINAVANIPNDNSFGELAGQIVSSSGDGTIKFWSVNSVARPDLKKINLILDNLLNYCQQNKGFSINNLLIKNVILKEVIYNKLILLFKAKLKVGFLQLENTGLNSSQIQKLQDIAASSRVTLPKTEISDNFLCPITNEIMFNPVNANDEQTYEEESLQKIFELAEQNKKEPISPITGGILSKPYYINRNLRSQIHEYLISNPKAWKKVYLPVKSIKDLEQACQNMDTDKLKGLLLKDFRLMAHPIKDNKTLVELLCEPLETGFQKLFPVMVQCMKQAHYDQLIRHKPLEYWLTLIAGKEDVENILSFIQKISNYPDTTITIDASALASLAIEKNMPSLMQVAYKLSPAIIYKLFEKHNTLLCLAAQAGKTEVVLHLIKIGAFVKHKNQDNLTAKELAYRNGHSLTGAAIENEKMQALLKQNGFFELKEEVKKQKEEINRLNARIHLLELQQKTTSHKSTNESPKPPAFNFASISGFDFSSTASPSIILNNAPNTIASVPLRARRHKLSIEEKRLTQNTDQASSNQLFSTSSAVTTENQQNSNVPAYTKK